MTIKFYIIYNYIQISVFARITILEIKLCILNYCILNYLTSFFFFNYLKQS